jgi:hypothetical protein
MMILAIIMVLPVMTLTMTIMVMMEMAEAVLQLREAAERSHQLASSPHFF